MINCRLRKHIRTTSSINDLLAEFFNTLNKSLEDGCTKSFLSSILGVPYSQEEFGKPLYETNFLVLNLRSKDLNNVHARNNGRGPIIMKTVCNRGYITATAKNDMNFFVSKIYISPLVTEICIS